MKDWRPMNRTAHSPPDLLLRVRKNSYGRFLVRVILQKYF